MRAFDVRRRGKEGEEEEEERGEEEDLPIEADGIQQ